MTDSQGLERGYRRILACYPRAFRRESEEEIVGVLLATARPGQRRVGVAESADLIRGAARMHRGPRLPRALLTAIRLTYVGAAAELAVLIVLLVTAASLASASIRRYPDFSVAQQISAHNLNERLGVAGPDDELKELGDTIDGLLQRLEAAFNGQRRFVANASHELRTPLATIRASLDVAVAKPEGAPPQTIALAARLRAELDRIDSLLEAFLVLARAQHGSLPGYAVLPLDYIVGAALADQRAAIRARNLTVQDRTDPGGAWVRGSQALLSRMVENLVDNAVCHNEHGGWLQVTAQTEAGRARLIVENGGQILDPRQVDELSQPFRRLGADRIGTDKGSGLGLSIVAAIAEAHDGRLSMVARPGGGLRVCVDLPAAAAAESNVNAGVPGMRVLVVEDSRSLAEVLVEGLRDQGMAVDAAHDGLEAAAKLDLNPYDVVVLDRDLPGIHGDALCQMITDRNDRAMVLMLTAAGAPGDRVTGLGLGADDYLGKPFHFPELVLRIRALARRQPSARSRLLRAAGIELDPLRRTVTRDGRQLDLSVKEFGVLEALLVAGPAFLSTEDLLEQVWDEQADPFTNTVTVTIGRLRRKLGDPPVISTTPGVGYRISSPTG